MAVYTLPELNYDYAALEPHISAKIMELHHSKHHKAYVDGANTALDKLAEAREAGDFANVSKLEKDLAFNLGGHVNHTIFWNNMAPDAGGTPEGEIADAIKDSFGSFDSFKKQFTAVATSIQGSGWSILAYDSVSKGLLTFQLFDQQGNVPVGVIPLLQLDMWEHAFYLDYLNVKGDYVTAWWNLVNWDNVNSRLAMATSKASGLIVPA